MDKSEYRQGFSGLLKNKLTIAQNKDGELSLDAYKAAEMMNNALSYKANFIGVMPHGSRLRGYSKPDSDIDLVVLSENLPSGHPSSNFHNLVDRMAEAVGSEMHIKIHPDTEIVNPGVVHDPEFQRRLITGQPYDLRNFAYLCSQNVIGPKIEDYRKRLRQKMKELPKKDIPFLIEAIANSVVDGEMKRMDRVVERIPDLPSTQALSVRVARKDLWREQIRRALELR